MGNASMTKTATTSVMKSTLAMEHLTLVGCATVRVRFTNVVVMTFQMTIAIVKAISLTSWACVVVNTANADQDGICDAYDQDGYWIDVQTYAVHTEGDLAGQTTYRVYVVCEAPTDLLYRIAGSGLQPWVVESSTGMWFSSPNNESWNASGMVVEDFGSITAVEYDSFLTLGWGTRSRTFAVCSWVQHRGCSVV